MHTEADEKGGGDIKDSGSVDDVSVSDIDKDDVYSLREQRAIIHRIDRRLVITCGIIYCFSLIDRGNLGNAAIAGMTDELSLGVHFRYSIIVLVFFPTYVVFQPPATVLTRKLGPRKFLASICLLWGVIEIVGTGAHAFSVDDELTFVKAFGFVHKWTHLVALRVLLGILESGLYPSIVYLLATWYSRYDVGKRYSAFYIIGCIALAFGGILAFGLMQMDGLAGKAGWRWIFIIEGTITCVVSFGAYFFLVDFPEKAHTSWNFLNQQECDFVIRRVNKDRGDALPESFTLARFLKPALDFKLWAFALISFFIITVTTSISVFLPIILKTGMGFSTGASQCLAAPPYVLAVLLMMLSAYLGDHYQVRGPILIVNSLIALIGLPLMGFASTPAARYFGVFLVTAGTNANIPTALAYQANNVRGQWKRALCSAMFVAFGGIGGISGGTIFRAQDAPRYLPGIGAAIACNALVILSVLALSGSFWLANRKADRGEIVIEGSRTFRYTI
ncbi:MAG: hypothetical protein HETSPECPRED_008285 [Heterodermia speciosa]|uniref:Major facilitator superfamily (MFS) profile domain-containing protein n=1 Tax=Heterodermia speciosa TaxID=116794 RepID=A0A8H3IU15_9LECA|nr:MAG: hypothetical protein HETSPECPRED_008285 [Heterodermia speciosa]